MPLREWAHCGAQGGLLERECVMAALRVQVRFESAMQERADLSMISSDYWKFFDTFDQSFMEQTRLRNRAFSEAGCTYP